MEGLGNGSGVPYSKTGDKEQDEVMRFHVFKGIVGGRIEAVERFTAHSLCTTRRHNLFVYSY